MSTYATPARSEGHAGDGPVPTGHARPDVSDAESMEKLGEDGVFLPTHTTSNPRTGKGFTVEIHHQR
eukprot:8287203-Karenia_brevis.AAC.1